ncbi:MAG: hypothetical protein AAGA96_02210 [Verrucomicrobiota bacterium]
MRALYGLIPVLATIGLLQIGCEKHSFETTKRLHLAHGGHQDGGHHGEEHHGGDGHHNDHHGDDKGHNDQKKSHSEGHHEGVEDHKKKKGQAEEADEPRDVGL